MERERPAADRHLRETWRMAPSVLIADDHPATRAGVRVTLEEAGFVVCAEVGTGAAAVEAARRLHPDICLLDIHMPGGGVEAARAISGELDDTVVVMLTVAQDDEHLFAALRAGAAGYLLKDISGDRLSDALRAVLRGEAAIPRTLVARVVDEFRERGRRRLFLPGRRPLTLSNREWEVLQALRDGLTTNETADLLSIAPVTVRTHVASILHKLRVDNRAAAVRLVEEEP
jgi:DNA-binding NarL/FixJ family response regulator